MIPLSDFYGRTPPEGRVKQHEMHDRHELVQQHNSEPRQVSGRPTSTSVTEGEHRVQAGFWGRLLWPFRSCHGAQSVRTSAGLLDRNTTDTPRDDTSTSMAEDVVHSEPAAAAGSPGLTAGQVGMDSCNSPMDLPRRHAFGESLHSSTPTQHSCKRPANQLDGQDHAPAKQISLKRSKIDNEPQTGDELEFTELPATIPTSRQDLLSDGSVTMEGHGSDMAGAQSQDDLCLDGTLDDRIDNWGAAQVNHPNVHESIDDAIEANAQGVVAEEAAAPPAELASNLSADESTDHMAELSAYRVLDCEDNLDVVGYLQPRLSQPPITTSDIEMYRAKMLETKLGFRMHGLVSTKNVQVRWMNCTGDEWDTILVRVRRYLRRSFTRYGDHFDDKEAWCDKQYSKAEKEALKQHLLPDVMAHLGHEIFGDLHSDNAPETVRSRSYGLVTGDTHTHVAYIPPDVREDFLLGLLSSEAGKMKRCNSGKNDQKPYLAEDECKRLAAAKSSRDKEQETPITDRGQDKATHQSHPLLRLLSVEERHRYYNDANNRDLTQVKLSKQPILFVWQGAGPPRKANNQLQARDRRNFHRDLPELTAGSQDLPVLQKAGRLSLFTTAQAVSLMLVDAAIMEEWHVPRAQGTLVAFWHREVRDQIAHKTITDEEGLQRALQDALENRNKNKLGRGAQPLLGVEFRLEFTPGN